MVPGALPALEAAVGVEPEPESAALEAGAPALALDASPAPAAPLLASEPGMLLIAVVGLVVVALPALVVELEDPQAEESMTTAKLSTAVVERWWRFISNLSYQGS